MKKQAYIQKRVFLVLFITLLITLACNLSQTTSPPDQSGIEEDSSLPDTVQIEPSSTETVLHTDLSTYLSNLAPEPDQPPMVSTVRDLTDLEIQERASL